MRGSDRDAIREDIRPYLGTTVEDRVRIAESLCEFAAEQIAARSDRARVLAYEDALPPSSVALWSSLVARYRARRRPSP